MNTTEDMNTRLTKEDQAIIKKARRNKVSGPIYSEDGLRLLKVLGNPELVEVEDGVKAICDYAFLGLNNLHDVKNILVLQNAFEKTRKQMKVNTLSINALSDNLNFPMFPKLTLKKT